MGESNEGIVERFAKQKAWWATKDLNLGPLPCEGSALTTELVARSTFFVTEGWSNCKP
jgi:hypothetical protein